MGYFQVRYDSRVVNYDRRGFIRLATGVDQFFHNCLKCANLLQTCSSTYREKQKKLVLAGIWIKICWMTMSVCNGKTKQLPLYFKQPFNSLSYEKGYCNLTNIKRYVYMFSQQSGFWCLIKMETWKAISFENTILGSQKNFKNTM